MVRLYLMSLKGYAVLNKIVNSDNEKLVSEVVYSNDRNVVDDKSEDIISLCKKYRIAYYNASDSLQKFSGYAIAISWRWIIPNINNLIILHDSLLPKYRGFAPLVTALKNGEKYIGVTALYASEHYDEGPIISQKKIAISYPIKIERAIEIISNLYQDIVMDILSKLYNGNELNGIPQEHSQATYSLWLDFNDYKIDWWQNSKYIEKHVNAVSYPYLGAKTYIKNNLYTILDGETVDDVHIEIRMPGKVIFMDNQKPIVVCGKGLYKINKMIDEHGNDCLPLVKFRTRFI